MNIYQKINEVMRRIEYLTKDDQVSFGTTKYKAISEEKVTTAVRKELVDLGIVIVPVEQQLSVTELIRTDKSVNQRTDVNVLYRIQNIDDVNDFIVACSSGSGVDTQDKGVGKAMTYSYKYLLLRTFAIPTGEDPDKISSAETDSKIEKEIGEIQATINDIIEKSIREEIKKAEIPNEQVLKVLKKYGASKLSEIKINDFVDFRKELLNVE